MTDSDRHEVREWIRTTRRGLCHHRPATIELDEDFQAKLAAYVIETNEFLGTDVVDCGGDLVFCGVRIVSDTPHSPFLRAILSEPDRDLPRLIYADYLDDRHEHARAEFIRVQVELARTSEPELHCIGYIGKTAEENNRLNCTQCKREEKECRYHQLRARERELLNPIYAKDGWPVGFAEYRRGFAEEITCSWEDWIRLLTVEYWTAPGSPTGALRTFADAIRAATPLRKVRLTTEPGFYVGEGTSGNPSLFLQGHGTHGYQLVDPDAPPSQEQRKQLLDDVYPGIEFELPQPGGLSATTIPRLVNRMMQTTQ